MATTGYVDLFFVVRTIGGKNEVTIEDRSGDDCVYKDNILLFMAGDGGRDKIFITFNMDDQTGLGFRFPDRPFAKLRNPIAGAQCSSITFDKAYSCSSGTTGECFCIKYPNDFKKDWNYAIQAVSSGGTAVYLDPKIVNGQNSLFMHIVTAIGIAVVSLAVGIGFHALFIGRLW